MYSFRSESPQSKNPVSSASSSFLIVTLLREKVDKKIGYFGKRFKASSTIFFCASVGGSAASFRNATASLPFRVGGGFGSISDSTKVCKRLSTL